MSTRISDFKGAPISLFGQATDQTTGTGVLDPSETSLIGSKFQLADGRTVALVSVGTSNLASGVLVQSSAQVTAFQGLAITVPTTYPATAGTNTILVTNGSTVLNINQFAGGQLIVASGTGAGQILAINSHQAAANGATFVVTLADNIVTTLDATSTVSLLANPYQAVIISPTTATGTIVGSTLYPLTAGVANTYNGTSGALSVQGTQQFGFIVTHGYTAVLSDSTAPAVGAPISPSTSTAGAFEQSPYATNVVTLAVIGYAAQTSTSAKYSLVYLTL